MHVRTGRTAGAADDGDCVALLHGLADPREIAGIVAVPRHVARWVRDLDHVAVAVLPARVRNDTRTDGHDARTCRTGEIDTGVERAAARERVGAIAEVRGNPPSDQRQPARDD